MKDTASISLGQKIFNNNCSGCHSFYQDGMGPNLSGLMDRRSLSWIQQFLKDPKAMQASGDEKARKLFSLYQTTMPSFGYLAQGDINSLIAFINTNRDAKIISNTRPLNKSIVPPVLPSSLSVEIKLVTQIPASNNKSPLARIVKMDYIANTDKLFINDLRGKLYQLHPLGVSVYLDLKKSKPRFIDQPGLGTGFGSFAFHPEFKKNGFFYTTHTEAVGTRKADFSYGDSIKPSLQWVLTEWQAKDLNKNGFCSTSRELLRIDMISPIHGVQDIAFNPFASKGKPDYGKIYVGIGDGGAAENRHAEYTHRLDKIWGTIIRIDPRGNNSVNGQYGIPQDNPFTKNNKGILKEIFAYGFRNPNQFSWSNQQLMLGSNIGQANIEALNRIVPGQDYGWPEREGTFAIDQLANLNRVREKLGPDASPIIYPVAQYDHSTGIAIAGGFSYLGSELKKLRGKYLFGDIVSGKLFYVESNLLQLGKQAPIKQWWLKQKGKKITLKDLCESDRVDLRFGRDRRGEMYLLTKADGKVYMLVAH
ncbi:MAG: hypothetical protein NVS9B7_14480 [Flavisolibacter sp.]